MVSTGDKIRGWIVRVRERERGRKGGRKREGGRARESERRARKGFYLPRSVCLHDPDIALAKRVRAIDLRRLLAGHVDKELRGSGAQLVLPVHPAGMMLPWLFLLAVGAVAGSPQVRLQQGLLEGTYVRTLSGRDVSAFWGIPYAKPPVGKHRFEEAIAAGPWLGVLNATNKPSDCMQLANMADKGSLIQIFGQEDCLYLNVFTPSAEEGKNMDVIVYIHGGAFMSLGSSFFEPIVLLDRDIVLVTINYRLGILGFLSTGDNVVPGNNGLKDQVLALKWVQANIRSFGGNPNGVTIAGHSAGGASVHYHLLSPLSIGLFHRAIVISGTALNPWALVDGVQEKSRIIGSSLGCPTNDSLLLVQCLRGRQAGHITALAKRFQGYQGNPFCPIGPTVEIHGPNAFLSAKPEAILSQGLANDVPILISFTSEEGAFPGAELISGESNLAHLRQHIRTELAHVLDYNWTLPAEKHLEVAEKILSHYKVDLNTEQGERNFIKMLSDRLFTYGIVKAAKLHAAHGNSPVYLFRFSFRGNISISAVWTNKSLGVAHGDDILYVMPMTLFNEMKGDDEIKISHFFLELWTDFVKDGTLSEPWTSLENGKILDLKGPGRLEEYEDPDPGQMTFWDPLALDYLPISPKTKDEL